MGATVKLTSASQVMAEDNLTPVTLTKEQQQQVEDKYSQLNKHMDFSRDNKAKYKLELCFNHKRSRNGLNACIMHFWESGAALHGGGDTRIYLCPGSKIKGNGCMAPIPDSSNSNGKLICSSCGCVWDCEEVIGEIYFNLPLQLLAESINKYYHVLNMHADIYVKYSQDDLRSTMLSEQERNRGGELFAKVRAKRSMSIYPLANIIKDTGAGADLLKRFYAFLSA